MSVRRRRIKERLEQQQRWADWCAEMDNIIQNLGKHEPDHLIALAEEACNRVAGDPAEWIPRVAAASAAMDD